jgi:hypothetical protein
MNDVAVRELPPAPENGLVGHVIIRIKTWRPAWHNQTGYKPDGRTRHIRRRADDSLSDGRTCPTTTEYEAERTLCLWKRRNVSYCP